MLTTKEIKDKAERSYKDFLISVLRRDIFFPFHIKGNKGNVNAPLQDLYPALKHLIEHSKEKIGYGYSLTYKEVNTRHSGIITMPEAIFFENPQDFLKFIDKEQAFLTFRKAADLTKKQIPALLKWIEENVLKCQKNAAHWDAILKIIHFFIQNPKPNCYWRQLPIAIDLAQLEPFKTLIGELLDFILPPNLINQNETQFELRFNLLYDEPVIRLRFLGENDFLSPLSIGNDFSLPLSKIGNWTDIPCDTVFLITDKDVFLSFPKLENSVAIYWEHTNDVLSKINWLCRDVALQRLYVGDITPRGFEQLSEMRAILPNLKAFMMDKTVFDAFPQHHQTQKIINANSFLIHLTQEEHFFYNYLLNLKELNGLLQKDIAYSFLEKQVILLKNTEGV